MGGHGTRGRAHGTRDGARRTRGMEDIGRAEELMGRGTEDIRRERVEDIGRGDELMGRATEDIGREREDIGRARENSGIGRLEHKRSFETYAVLQPDPAVPPPPPLRRLVFPDFRCSFNPSRRPVGGPRGHVDAAVPGGHRNGLWRRGRRDRNVHRPGGHGVASMDGSSSRCRCPGGRLLCHHAVRSP